MTIGKKVKLRITIKIAVMLALLILFVILYILFGKSQSTFFNTGAIVILSLVYVFLLYKIKLFQLIFDRTYKCSVVKCELKTVFVPVGYIRPIIREKLVISLTVKRENGKIIKKQFDADNLNPLYYASGAEVMHHKGAPYYVKVNPSENEFFCPMCSRPTYEDKPRHCGFCKIDF